MRNINIIANAGFLALATLATALASPIPASLVTFGRQVDVKSRVYPISSGGSFKAFVGNPLLTPGFETTFWCVDFENDIAPGNITAKFTANIVLVSDTATQHNFVRKGNATVWADGEKYTPQQRYNAAAFLVEKIIAGGSGYSDVDLQHAIWRLTDTGGADTQTSWENPAYGAAQTFITSLNPTTQRTWATVTGVANVDGSLLDRNTRQTFLVEVASVPEPGTYALMGGGLIILAGLRRRRSSN